MMVDISKLIVFLLYEEWFLLKFYLVSVLCCFQVKVRLNLSKTVRILMLYIVFLLFTFSPTCLLIYVCQVPQTQVAKNSQLHCLGEITSPPDGTHITVLPGSTVNITWSFNDDVAQLVARVWYFTSSDGSFVNERLAIILLDGQPQIDNSGLSGASIVKPATLLLKNVNETYDGTYQFQLSAPGSGSTFEVVVFIASKF